MTWLERLEGLEELAGLEGQAGSSILKSGLLKSAAIASISFESLPSVSSSTLDLEIFGLRIISSIINPPSFKLIFLISFATAWSGSEKDTFKISSGRDSFTLRSLTLGTRAPLLSRYSSSSLSDRTASESPKISRITTESGISSKYSFTVEKICS